MIGDMKIEIVPPPEPAKERFVPWLMRIIRKDPIPMVVHPMWDMLSEPGAVLRREDTLYMTGKTYASVKGRIARRSETLPDDGFSPRAAAPTSAPPPKPKR